MAHGHRNARWGTREGSNFANRRLRFPSGLSPFGFSGLSSFVRRPALAEFEDRRQWHPEGYRRPARSFSNPRHRFALVDKVYRGGQERFNTRSPFISSQTRATIAFAFPRKVLVCVRRKMRREVLHARGVAGGVGFKRPRYSEYSSVRCS